MHSNNQQVFINGSRDELGDWQNGTGPKFMDRVQAPETFMPEKYGQKVQPMQTTLRFKNDLSDSNAYINYKYLTNRNEI